MTAKLKTCIKCEVILDASNTTWYRQKNYIHKCNECVREEKRLQAIIKRKRDPKLAAERCARHKARLKADDPVRYSCHQMAASAAKRAKALGRDYDLTSDFLLGICPASCPILGVELKYGGGQRSQNSCSIDRIDSTKGYTKDNVQIVSYLANLMKNEANDEQLVKFALWVLKSKGVQTDALGGK